MATLQDPGSPLDDIAFLARSPHRVGVLEVLSRGDRTRAELHEETDIIQPTLGRVLTALEDRGWVRNGGSAYSLTPFGSVLAEEFGELVGVVDTMRAFREVAGWLPLDELPFDLRRFGDATVTTPTRGDATAHLRREEELAAGAETLRHLCSSAFPPHIRTYRDRIVEGGQRFEAVITGDALDAAATDPETADWVRDIAGAENATIYRYEGPVPYQLGMADDIALIVPLDGAGAPCALVESEDEVVRAWVTERLETLHSQSTVLG